MNPNSLDERIERWQKNLLDLTLRNRLLNFKPATAVRVLAPKPERLFELVAEEEATLTARELLGGEDLKPAVKSLSAGEVLLENDPAGSRLRRMRLKARGAVQEQGTNILFLAFGMVRWHEKDDPKTALLAPLVLVPVELLKQGPLQPFKLRAVDDDVVANPTLVYKLSTNFGIELPEWTEPTSLPDYLKKAREALEPMEAWKITDEAYLSLLSFSKLSMYKEMSASRETMAQHPLLRAISGDPSLMPPVPDYPTGERLDREVLPNQSFQILDADSSQQEAVEMAKRGITFVLQGPPGTGKSQTIANIIAESMAAGKKVLFVSEKMAALEVVKRRLDENGLGDYCLELHSHKAKKSSVIEELRRCVQPPEVKPAPAEELGRLQEVRSLLNSYVRALHEVREPFKRSVFQVNGMVAPLYDLPPLPVPVDTASMRPEDLEERVRLARRIQAMRDAIGRQDRHAWRDLRMESWKPGDHILVERALRGLISGISRVMEKAAELSDLAGSNAPNDLSSAVRLVEQMRRAASTPFPDKEWLTGRPEQLLKELDEIREFYEMRAQRQEWLSQSYKDSVLTLDAPEMLERLRAARFLGILSKRYRSDRAILLSFRKGGGGKRYDNLVSDLEAIDEIKASEGRLEEMAVRGAALFGAGFKGEHTDWDDLKTCLMWTAYYLRDFGPYMNPKMVEILTEPKGPVVRLSAPVREAEKSIEELQETLREVQARFYLEDFTPSADLADLSFLEDFAADHLAEIGSLKEWVEMHALEQACRENDMEALFALAGRSALPDGDLGEIYRKRALQAWLEAVTSGDEWLRYFWGDEHQQVIEQFRKLDLEQLSTARRRLEEKLAEARVQRLEYHSWTGEEMNTLKRELEKKKHFKQVRQLFSECPKLLLELKPCLLMSPLSVSTFLDPTKVKFDLVIFDEASQIRPEDAVGSIMRAGQVIVVGDSRQLPPTSFFRALAGEEEEEARVEDLESILDECSAASVKQHMLLWHYRSRHEALIAFSNRFVYGDRLFTFPSAGEEGGGVKLVRANGTYDRGGTRTNAVEAEKVTELVREHFETAPQRSLGVIAFSEAQQMAILDQVDRLRNKRPDLEKYFAEGGNEEFFVKNLENVQGDERDVIILSVGYARGADGRMTQNFGPLNQLGGERRLNVAVTRAKRQVIIVSSIGAEDLQGASGAGPRLLRDYLSYAAAGGDRELLVGRKDQKSEAAYDFQFEEEVHKALTAEGLVVKKRVGCSGYRVDLAVENPDRPGTFVLGIECDGASYRSGKTARDRDRLREQALQNLGWKVHRIWSQDWVDDREKEIKKLKRVLIKAGYLRDEGAPVRSSGKKAAAKVAGAPKMRDAERPDPPVGKGQA